LKWFIVPTQPHEYGLKLLYLLPEFTILIPWVRKLVDEGGSLSKVIPRNL